MVELRVSTNSGIVAAALLRAPERVGPAIRGVAYDYANKGRTLILRNASGRPGPNVQTGDYRRAWTPVEEVAPGQFATGNNSPQARRLENGFFGTDSLGRTYRQRPYPHVAPAQREIRVPFQVATMKAAVAALRAA